MPRIDSDRIGPREFPDIALYGASTLRAPKNFDISPLKVGNEPGFVRPLAAIKKAAAKATREIKVLSGQQSRDFVSACDEILSGQYHERFVVDLFEGSGGTSINMNANEVIANRALQIMGRAAGQYAHLSPTDHVNTGQSTTTWCLRL